MLAMIQKMFKYTLVAGLVLTLLAGAAYAGFPEKPITFMVGRGAGGSTDKVARSFAPFFNKYIGVPVNVKNMKGAGGKIANKFVSKATPDGYTLIMGLQPSDAIQQVLKKPGYDFKDFVGICGIAGGDANAVIVPYNSEYKTFSELLEATKKKNSGMTFAGVATGTNAWLFHLQLQTYAGFKAKYIPFDSGREATMSVVGGHVTVGGGNSMNLPDLIKAKKIRALGVSSAKRLFYMLDVPTFIEMGYPKVFMPAYYLLFAPPKTPDDIRKVLEKAAAKAVADPEFVALMKRQGVSLDPKTAEETDQTVRDTFDKVDDLLKAVGK